MEELLVLPVLSALLIFSSAHDLCFRTIPNWVSIAILLISLGIRSANGQFLSSLLVVGIISSLLFVCWLRGWIGGGDMKLLSAVSAAVPPSSSFALIIDVALAGGVLAILYLLLRRLVGPPRARQPGDSLFQRILKTEARRIRRGGPLPYAMAILVGATITMWRG